MRGMTAEPQDPVDSVLHGAVLPALLALPHAMKSPRALVMLLAIGLQESRFEHRYQVVQGRPGAKGPARGFWQFEKAGGCAGVLTHPASRFWMVGACNVRRLAPTPHALWKSIETDDELAATAARLLLFTDPKPLPGLADAEGAWRYYLRNWRPGKPHRATWDALHARALAKVHQLEEAIP